MTKTKEQIQRENLRKTLTRLKLKVADMEKLWLEFFQDITSILVGAYYDTASEGEIGKRFTGMPVRDVVKTAREIADSMLDEYENRWGKG
jgi:hypothetical protein